MAAIFYNLGDDKVIFKGGFTVNTSVRIPFLNNLIGANALTIITSVSVQNNDTIQFFLTFDDLISYFYFGKGLGNITVSGKIFSSCDGSMPGIDIFYNQVGAFRGRTVAISFGNAVFSGVITSFSTGAQADPDNTVDFSITLNVINHSLPSPNFQPLC